MPVEINVGQPVISINHGSTFMVMDLNGEVAPDSEHGLFAKDTRFVSYYAIFANGQPWARLTSTATTYFSARVYLTNPQFATEGGDVAAGTLALVLTRTINDGVTERLEITNHSQRPVRFNLEIAMRSDFADLFEVRWHRFVRRGRMETRWDADATELTTTYDNRDFHRACHYRIQHYASHPHYANGRITFEIQLAPGAVWNTCADYILVEGEIAHRPAHRCDQDPAGSAMVELQQRWEATATRLTSSNEDVYRLYRQSIEDMGALRLYDHDFAPDVWIPAAGVPWFVTVFGRDSLIVSLQNMMVHPGFALGALKKLAELQATAIDDERDAQPGKIAHEIRYGELAHFHRIPHTPYYGTHDATPLFLITLHEAWKWMGDVELLRTYRDVALRCLEWIDRYGDLDGDGFQEHQSRSSQGYENQGWKDAEDAIVYEDGRQVHQPKALCEFQGYVFDAWMRMAEVFEALGEPQRAAALRRKAAELQRRFEAAFWCEEAGIYALALDPNKRPSAAVASNAGHVLWSGIASPERAARVVRRFTEPDMWSGWGIRTLSARNPAYNPTSYHTGSVWPHDNGIIALGFRRYGHAAAAAALARDVFDAAAHFSAYRLPELYCGFPRSPGSFPVLYLGANVPQAWAAGSVFHFLQAILGLRADAPNHSLALDPALPDWLPDLTLHALEVGRARVDIRFWRTRSGDTEWEVIGGDTGLTVARHPWGPWQVES